MSRAHEQWTWRWHAALKAAQRLGCHNLELTIAPPASEERIASVEAKLGFGIPPDFRSVLLEYSAAVSFRWHLPDSFEPPPLFRATYAGDCHWDLARLVALEEQRQKWVNICFPDQNDPYDVVWHRKFAFQNIGNDDLIAIDLDPDSAGRVVYLSHDDGVGHGVAFAPSFSEFIDRWTQLGCPGGEDSQIDPFLGAEGIDPHSETANAWRRLFGLAS